MINKKNFCLVAGILFWSAMVNEAVQAQVFKRTAITSFNVDNGLLQNTVMDMAVDKFGFVWFSTAAGIQRYDGRRFELVNLFGDLEVEKKSAYLNVLGNDEVWLSHINGITAYNPNTHRFTPVYQRASNSDILYLTYAGEHNGAVWYIDRAKGLLQFNRDNKKLISSVPAHLPGFPNEYSLTCKRLNRNVVAIASWKAISFFDMHQQKILYTLHSNEYIGGFVPFNVNTILIGKGGYYYTFNLQTRKETRLRAIEDQSLKDSHFEMDLQSNGNILCAYNRNVYEMDTATFHTKTKWSGLNQEYLLTSGFITKTYLDQFNQFWIMSNSDGVKRINIYQQRFDYYGTTKRENNFIRSIYVDKKEGLILAGTYGSGLIVFDSMGYLLRNIQVLSGPADGVMSITPLGKGKYLLLTLSANALYVWDRTTGKTTAVSHRQKPNQAAFSSSYYGGLHTLPNNTFLLTDHYAIRFRVAKGQVTDTLALLPYSHSAYNYVLTKRGLHCFSSYKGLYFFDSAFTHLRTVSYSPRFQIRCIAEDASGKLWFGTENGLYSADSTGKLLAKYTKAQGLPDEGIYAIYAAPGGIYFSHNKGLSFLDASGKMVHYNRSSGLQENEFNTNAAFKTKDGKLYFGGVNGITAFHPTAMHAQMDTATVYVTGLQVMDKPYCDTAVWNITGLTIPHNSNILSIHIGVPAGGNNNINFEYTMEGLDPGWSTTSGVDFIRYVLPPGQYTFRARISQTNNVLSKQTSLLITVTAPWWQQWWFKVLAILLLFCLVAAIVHQYNRRKYVSKIKQLEMEQRIQKERERISRDLHDNLGAYASAIAGNVEQVIKNPYDNKNLFSLKENASEIMNNLRDTIWALNRNEVTITRLNDRLNSFLQKMREAYPGVTIEVHEEISTGQTFSPEFALNVLRIVQEALHNAIKHSKGNSILIGIKTGEHFYLSICDNGIGMPDHDMAKQGYGIGNMKTRALENNLTLQITSEINKGTRVELYHQPTTKYVL